MCMEPCVVRILPTCAFLLNAKSITIWNPTLKLEVRKVLSANKWGHIDASQRTRQRACNWLLSCIQGLRNDQTALYS